ncbi:MAG: cytosine permease [Bifidobacteriaceae bacterium]|jgi:cytosine permease|nr:cytosine permease [Bifidobacteriaceae bacterium]
MSNENSGLQISEDQRQSWLSLVAVWAGTMICVPALMVGGMLTSGFTFGTTAVLVLLGYGLVILYMVFIGMASADKGLPTVGLASHALGTAGSKYVVSVFIAIASIGWFGIQSYVCGAAFASMIGQPNNVVLWTIIWGVVMLLTAVFGFKALKYLNYVAVPCLVLLLGYAAYAAIFAEGAWDKIVNYAPPAESAMPFLSGLTIVVGSFALGGVIAGDYTRYAKSRSDVIKGSILGVLPAALIVMLIGGASTIATNQYDISLVFQELGVPAFGILALVLATWTTNVGNAYSGGIAIANILGGSEKAYQWSTGVAGALGTVLGAVGIMNNFSDFLSILSAIIPPVAGVIIAQYWLLDQGNPDKFREIVPVNWAGLISYIVGAAVAYITTYVLPFFLPAINGIVIAGVLYIILVKVIPPKSEDREVVEIEVTETVVSD